MARLIQSEKFIWLVALLAVVVSLAPNFYGWLTAGANQYYFGAHFMDSADYPVYLSYIEQSRQGQLLFKNLYTTEPQNASLFSPLWLVAGWWGHLTGWSNVVVFHFFRALCSLGFLLAVYYLFIKKLFDKLNERLISFSLLVFSAGLGIWSGFFIDAKNLADAWLYVPVDLWAPETNTFLTISHSALFPLSQLLILVVFYLFLQKITRLRFFYLLLAIVFLAIIHPYDVIIIGAVLLVQLVFKSYQQKAVIWPLALTYLAMMASAGLVAAYYFFISQQEPAIAGFARQNVTLSPPVFNYLLGYGLVILLAAVGIWLVIKYRQEKYYFIVLWAATVSVLLYFPLDIQRRFTNAWHVALVILATIALAAFWQWQQKSKFWSGLSTVPATVIIVGLFLTNIGVLLQGFYDIHNREMPYILPQEFVAGFTWLKQNGSASQALLADSLVANLAPAFTGQIVYAGHGGQTIDYKSKKYLVDAWFYKTNNGDENKKIFLRDNGVDFIWYSAIEKNKGAFAPEQKDYLERVYRNSLVEIYQVKD